MFSTEAATKTLAISSEELMRYRQKRSSLSRQICEAMTYMERLLAAKAAMNEWENDLFARMEAASESEHIGRVAAALLCTAAMAREIMDHVMRSPLAAVWG